MIIQITPVLQNNNDFTFESLLSCTATINTKPLPELSRLNQLLSQGAETFWDGLQAAQTAIPNESVYSICSNHLSNLPYYNYPVPSVPMASNKYGTTSAIPKKTKAKKIESYDKIDRRRRNTESAKRCRMKKQERLETLQRMLEESEQKRRELERLLNEAQMLLKLKQGNIA